MEAEIYLPMISGYHHLPSFHPREVAAATTTQAVH